MSVKPKLLLVDDEQNILDGITRHLRATFDVHSTTLPAQGLERLEKEGGFAVVVSDMRMPVMTGAVFLARARAVAPDTVRVLLTGQSELDDAIAAINEGNIFRFLKKPCAPDLLRGALMAAVEQHRLVTAEKVLLEQTLRGAVTALSETLALANPGVFGTAARVKQTAMALAAALGVVEVWPIEIAAMVSQLGAVTLPADVHDRLVRNQALTKEEREMIDHAPEVTERLLAHIPRLDPVIEIVRYSRRSFHAAGAPGDGVAGTKIPIGARILRVAADFDELDTGGASPLAAFDQLRARAGVYDPDVLGALARMHEGRKLVDTVQEVPVAGLREGMVVAADVRTKGGALLVARGHAVTTGLVARLANFAGELSIKTVRVLVKCAPPSSSKNVG